MIVSDDNCVIKLMTCIWFCDRSFINIRQQNTFVSSSHIDGKDPTHMQYMIMHGIPWITIFGTSEAIPQGFSWVRKSQVKIIAESRHEWQKSLLAGTDILFQTHAYYFMPWTHRPAHNNHRTFISPLDGLFWALWRHHRWLFTRKLDS